MTSLASNTISPTQTSTLPASTSNTLSVPSAPPSTSGQSNSIAAATAGSQVTPSQVSHTKKFTPPIVSSTVGQSPSIVSGVQGTNAHTTNASPVNGKTQVSPAVPTVTPAMSTMSGNLIVNGTSGSSNNHGRKSSIVSGGSGGGTWGNPYVTRQQQHNPGQIQFGSLPPGGPVSSPNLAAPAVSNTRVASPQMSPAVPQPAVSGGTIKLAARDQNITFGSLGSNLDQRTLLNRPPMPPAAPAAQAPGHIRRESASSHQQHPEISQSGMGPNRGGGMPHNGSRRNQAQSYGGQNNFPQQGFGGNHNNFGNNRNPSNQARGAYPGAMNPHYHQPVPQQMSFSPRPPPRSPALHHTVPQAHSLPQTPQMGTVLPMANPGFQPTNIHPNVQHYPQQQQFVDPNIYHHGYPLFPQQYPAPPPASPRGHFAAMNPSPYLNFSHASPMSRSSSTANTEVHRPPSTYQVPHQPLSPPAPVTPTNSHLFQRPEKASKALLITDPDTGAARSFQRPPDTPRSKPAAVSSPLIVSSGSPTPRPTEANRKTDEEIRRELALQVHKKIEESGALEREKKAEAERLKREAEEAERRREEEEEEKRKEEEEEKKRKEEEEEKERLRKEAEEKFRLEEEERIRKEEETRIAKEKAEQEARIEKEKEEQARRIKEEQEEAERKAKAEAERKAKEEELAKEEEKRKVKEEADRLAKEEEERRAKEAETKAAAEAEAAKIHPTSISAEEAQEGSEKPEVIRPADAEDSSEQSMPGKQIAASVQSGAPEDATRHTAKSRASKPSPLVIKSSTESGPLSAALSALRSARPILDINNVRYPDNIMSPNPALNSSAPSGKFKYAKEFLLQFQTVFTEKPSADWDQRIKDTVGESTDSSRPPTARMQPTLGPRGSGSHPRSTSVQPSMGSMGSMGSFGSGKFALPANMLTSAQRFEQSSSRPPGAMSSNPLQNLAAVGQFRPAPPSISRTNSSQGLSQQSNPPQSPRVRTSQRTNSRRGTATPGGVGMERSESSQQAEPKPMLTASASDFKPLVASESRWKPRSVANVEKTGQSMGSISSASPPVPTQDNLLSTEMVQRKVKAALNKMTPEKFEKISGQILDIANQSRFETDGRTLKQVIQLTFEKATDEAAWSSMYAKFCKVMMESMDPSIKDESIIDPKTGNVVAGGVLFRKYLLNRCQEEFQRGWKVNLPPKPEGVTDEAAMLSDEYYIAAAAKRRGLGLIQFIGELFKLSMLTERIMHECVKKLVDYEGIPEEGEVEGLCKLLRTIGASLDSTAKSRPAMEAYFARIKQMIEHPGIVSRLKFMLMDIVDLRSKNWETDELNKGPKKLAEIQADVEKAAAVKEAASHANAQRGGRQVGRGDGRNFSQGGYGQLEYARQSTQNTLATDELRKLKPRDRNANPTPTFGLGPPSMFANRGSNPKKPSFTRGDDSGPASRTATPPSGAQREATRNSFHVLRDMGSQVNDGDANDSISPAPSVASSPPLAHASPAMRPLVGESDSK